VVLGIPSTRLGPRDLQRIGYVSASQRLPEWMTTEQLLDFCRPLYPSWDARLCSELLQRFGLPTKPRIRSLSRGMKMKTAVVAALAYRPRLLVLDEPFSGLDPVVRDEIIKGMLEMAGKGEWSILIASHDLSEVENLADHVGFLRDGRMMTSESLEDLQRRFREVEVTLAGQRPPLAEWPAQWMARTATERVARFVDSRYDEEGTQRQINQLFSERARYSTSPVSLREIFAALAQSNVA
jgi:ABC-2 type transport system ATP-binding protein